MKKNTSDRNGRAFEFKLVQTIFENCPNASLTKRALEVQERDEKKFLQLPIQLQQDFISASDDFFNRLGEFDVKTNEEFLIDRLPDSEAKKGNVTDINVTQGGSKINFSIKSNHKALKHQRPSTAVERLGLSKNHELCLDYRKWYKKTIAEFHEARRNLDPDATRYSELKSIDSDFINDYLYAPFCRKISEIYCTQGQSQEAASSLFTFLVGCSNYYKITHESGSIRSEEFFNISSPSWLSSAFNERKPNYVNLKFSNDWKISMRLHTCSGTIKPSVDLKFDTQKIE